MLNGEGTKIVSDGDGEAARAGRSGREEGFAAWSDTYQAQTLVVRELDRRLKEEFGLPLASFEVLARLAAMPEGRRMRMQELARKVFLSKSGISQLFTRLEKRGLVERRGDPENLRVTYATITGEGREALRRAMPTFREEVERRFARHLDDEELGMLRRAMRKIIRGNGDEPLSDEPEAGA